MGKDWADRVMQRALPFSWMEPCVVPDGRPFAVTVISAPAPASVSGAA